MIVVFVSSNDPSVVLQPRDGSFDFPAFSIPPEFFLALGRRSLASFFVWANEFDVAIFKATSERIAVGEFQLRP